MLCFACGVIARLKRLVCDWSEGLGCRRCASRGLGSRGTVFGVCRECSKLSGLSRLFHGPRRGHCVRTPDPARARGGRGASRNHVLKVLLHWCARIASTTARGVADGHVFVKEQIWTDTGPTSFVKTLHGLIPGLHQSPPHFLPAPSSSVGRHPRHWREDWWRKVQAPSAYDAQTSEGSTFDIKTLLNHVMNLQSPTFPSLRAVTRPCLLERRWNR